MADILLRQEAYRKLYPRDSQRICTAYSCFARTFADCIYDRFGIIDDVPKPFRMPVYTDADVVEESFKRVRELGPCNIAWSGGVDSSFLIACFIHEGVDFKVCYNDVAEGSAPKLLAWLNQKKIELKKITELKNFAKQRKLVTGDVVDTLLFPSPAGMQNYAPGKDIFKALVNRYGNSDGERLIELIKDLGRRFDRSVDTNENIVRLLSWICLYYAHREAFYHMIGGNDDLICFFDTQVFTDISYSRYWNNRLALDNKTIFRRVLYDVFGKISGEINWQRSFYYRTVRNIRF